MDWSFVRFILDQSPGSPGARLQETTTNILRSNLIKLDHDRPSDRIQNVLVDSIPDRNEWCTSWVDKDPTVTSRNRAPGNFCSGYMLEKHDRPIMTRQRQQSHTFGANGRANVLKGTISTHCDSYCIRNSVLVSGGTSCCAVRNLSLIHI